MLIDGKPVEVLETPYREVAYLRAENERLKTTLCKYQHIASPEDRKVTRLITEIERLKAELAEAKKDADLWRDLLSHQKFNNVSAVGYAINRAKERQAMKGK